MNKRLLIFLLILLFLPNVYGQQQKCTLATKSTPSFRGLSLFMSEQQVSKVLGQSFQTKPSKTAISLKMEGDKILEYPIGNKEYETNKMEFDIGVRKFEYNRSVDKFSLPKDFEDILTLKLSFYQGALVAFYITYDTKNVHWESVDEFVSNITEKIGISKNYWEISENERLAGLICSGFTVAVIFNSNDSITIAEVMPSFSESVLAKAMYFERLKEITTKDFDKKKTFKP